MAKTAELKEKVAKDALENLDWPKLKNHFDEIVLDEDKFSVLLGHIRRTSSLVMAYPDAKREKQREEFLGRLQDYAHAKLGQFALQLTQEGTLLNKIERGYRSILELLQQCDISSLPANVRAAAYISRAAGQCDLVTTSLHDALKARKEIGLSPGILLRNENDAPFSPNAAITAIVECLTITLVMEAYKNKWFDAERNVVLSTLPTVGDQERYKAGSTKVLALCWRRWRRTEQRRFLGGEFEEKSKSDLPNGIPNVIERLTIYNPPKTEIFDHVANERLNDRLGQTFMEMLVETNLQEKAVGIKHNVALPPSGMISPEEGYSGVSLSEIVSYSIVDDQGDPAVSVSWNGYGHTVF